MSNSKKKKSSGSHSRLGDGKSHLTERDVREYFLQFGEQWLDLEAENHVLMYREANHIREKRIERAPEFIAKFSDTLEYLLAHHKRTALLQDATVLYNTYTERFNKLAKDEDEAGEAAGFPLVHIPPPHEGKFDVRKNPILTNPEFGGPLPIRPHAMAAMLQELNNLAVPYNTHTDVVVFVEPLEPVDDPDGGETEYRKAEGAEKEWLLCRVHKAGNSPVVVIAQTDYPQCWPSDRSSCRQPVSRSRIIPIQNPAHGSYYLMRVGERCRAVWPTTTVLYPAVVVEEPSFANEWCYRLRFDGTEDEHEPRLVYARYVVPYMEISGGRPIPDPAYPTGDTVATADDVRALYAKAGGAAVLGDLLRTCPSTT